MEKKIVTLNNAEANIYGKLLDLRKAWFDAEDKLNDENYVTMFPIVNAYEKEYFTVRGFVMDAFNVSAQFIEELLTGKYEIRQEA